MRLSFTESDLDPTPHLDPAVRRAAAEHIAEQEQAAGWVDPDKTRVVPVTAPRFTSTRPFPDPAEPTINPAEPRVEPSKSTVDAEPAEEKKSFLGLSPTQILGGALASSTAAVAGSHLGVAGTVVGAALTSIVAAVASAAYTKSLSKTGSSLSVVVSRFRLGGTTPLKNVPDLAEDGGGNETAVLGTPPAEATEVGIVDSAPRASWRDRFSPVHLLATAAAVFLLAAVVVTGLEALRGQSFSGDGPTTVGQISREGISGSTSRGGSADTSDRNTEPAKPKDEVSQPVATPTRAAAETPTPTPSSTPRPTPTSSASTGTGTGDTSTGTGSTGTGGASADGTGTSGSGSNSTGSGAGSSAVDPGTTGTSG